MILYIKDDFTQFNQAENINNNNLSLYSKLTSYKISKGQWMNTYVKSVNKVGTEIKKKNSIY